MNELYNQMKQKIANKLALILSIAIVLSSFSLPLAPTVLAVDLLPAPQNVKVTGVTHKSVTLEWDPVDGVDENSGYQVWYANGGWAAWTGNTSATITNLNPNTTYSFYVTAIAASNDRSALVTAKTEESDPNMYSEPPLSPPHNLVITDITESEIKLSWTGSPGAKGYDIYVNNRWSAGIWNGSNTYTYSVPKTVTGSVYFEVAAQITPSDVSTRSNRVTIEWGKLSKPKDLKIVSSTRSSVALGWAPTPGATEYEIYQGDTVIASTYSNRYVATELTEGESYDFKIVAKNKLWESPASDLVTAVPGSNYNIVTYYNSWSRNPSERNYSVADVAKDIGTDKLTHINYAFADLCWKESGSRGRACENPDTPLQDRYVFDGEMVLGDPTEDEINIRDLQALKTANPNLNLMISVGGRSWSKNFSNMANTEVNRRLFANSAVEFLREYGFDGLDIDWEYPVVGGDIDNSRRPEDKQNYTLLMKTVREALDAAGSIDGKYYLLTIASYQGESFVANADLANSSEYIDFINIMTYDYSGSWNTYGYHNTPLFYDPASPSASAKHNNVNSSVAGHLNGGVPNHKLVLGVPFYGNGWIGCEARGEYVPCAEFAPFGTWENGKFDSYDLENNYLTNTDYVRYWNESAKVPYLYNEADGTFISYDDTESMMYKASLVKTLDLAGVMSWDITGDRNGTLSTQLANDLPIHGIMNTNALAAPQHVVSMSKTDTTINVGWDTVAGATGYDVFANKVWQGYTEETTFNVTKLTPNSENVIEIISIDKDGSRIERVSAMSKALKVMTNLAGDTGTEPEPEPSTDSGTEYIPLVPVDKIKLQITKSGNKTIAKLDERQAIGAIRQSTTNHIQLIVEETDTNVEIDISALIIKAIAEKGTSATLSIVLHNIEYIVPIGALTLHLGSDVLDFRFTIQTPAQSVGDQMKAKGIKTLVEPTQFKIEVKGSDPIWKELTEFNGIYISRIFKLGKADFNQSKATGVVFDPATGEYHHVPTVFTNHPDGTADVTLKRAGNSIYTVIASAVTFDDVTAAWAQSDVETAASKLIVSGTDGKLFGAEDKITRGEFVTIVVKALGVMPSLSNSTFHDVNSETKFAPDIIAATEIGIIKGKTATTFDPNAFITRQDMAVVIANAMQYAGDLKRASNVVMNPYADRGSVAAYAQSAVALMIDTGIITGISETKLDPKSNTSKAQATVVVMRMLRALSFSN
ncbi:glycosyl hydrolase family 18 protein [Paenibacillus yanchengensis]|uniref:chitinase n=1 Tax=Paenibacillus yanchengensis TaxID=2035833 RepID=A0ABW4YQP5_9BACL